MNFRKVTQRATLATALGFAAACSTPQYQLSDSFESGHGMESLQTGRDITWGKEDNTVVIAGKSYLTRKADPILPGEEGTLFYATRHPNTWVDIDLENRLMDLEVDHVTVPREADRDKDGKVDTSLTFKLGGAYGLRAEVREGSEDYIGSGTFTHENLPASIQRLIMDSSRRYFVGVDLQTSGNSKDEVSERYIMPATKDSRIQINSETGQIRVVGSTVYILKDTPISVDKENRVKYIASENERINNAIESARKEAENKRLEAQRSQRNASLPILEPPPIIGPEAPKQDNPQK